jgi:hypothetical protein
MAKKLEGTIFLCLGVNGMHTPMEEVRVRLEKPKGKEQFLKERGGKRKFPFDAKFMFKPQFKNRNKVMGFSDMETLLPLDPQEVMKGLQFSRTDIKNAISYQLDAERELRARYKTVGIDTQSKFLLAALIVFLIALTVVTLLYGQALGHPVIQVYTQSGIAPNKTGPLAGIGNSIGQIGSTVGSIP